MVIDAHHHFWRYDPVEYGWIGADQTVLQADHLPADLRPQLLAAGVDGVVSVQARTTLAETDWLLSLADEHSWMKGVVGWFPLTDPAVGGELDARNDHPKLVAVREILQGQPESVLADPALDRGLAEVERCGLVYDLLIYHDQLEPAIALVDRHPDLTMVLDHIAKPAIRDGEVEPWKSLLRELAARERVACKLSGMVTEADPAQWSIEQLRPYAEIVLEAFGPERVMFGSDWPVCRLGVEYAAWRRTVDILVSDLSADERARVMGGTAIEWYGLGG